MAADGQHAGHDKAVSGEKRKHADSAPAAVLIRVGDARYTESPIAWVDLQHKTRVALLTALHGTSGIEGLFGDNTAWLASSVTMFCVDLEKASAKLSRSDVEAADAVEAEAAAADGVKPLPVLRTIQQVAQELGVSAEEVLFIRVHLPPPPAGAAGGTSAAGSAAAMAATGGAGTAASAGGSWPSGTRHVSTCKEEPPGSIMRAAAAAIRSGAMVLRSDGHLEMPSGVVWPFANSRLLFVRAFYAPLFESVLGRCVRCTDADVGQHYLAITGQPGIGKSVFGWYLIWRILTEQPDRTVIYASWSHKTMWFFTPDGCVRTMSVTSDADLVYLNYVAGLGPCPLLIADSLLPPPLPFPTISITSPGRLSAWGKEDKRHLRSPFLYMPLPTAEEVRALRALAFSSTDVDACERRMQLWGPIPSLVLDRVLDVQQRECWDEASAVPLSKLIAIVRRTAREEASASRAIIHERARGQHIAGLDVRTELYFERGQPVLASAVIEQHVVQRIQKEHEWHAAFLLDGSARIGALGAWRGNNTERVALCVLEEGGTFRARRLVPSGPAALEEELVLAANLEPRRVFCAAEALADHKSHSGMVLPSVINFPGLDALLWDSTVSHHWPIDVTVSSTHGIHAAGLADAVTRLGWTPDHGWGSATTGADMEIKYFWGVPQQQFEDGWKQARKAKAGSTGTELAATVFSHVTQYAVCIPAASLVKRMYDEMEGDATPAPAALLPAHPDEPPSPASGSS